MPTSAPTAPVVITNLPVLPVDIGQSILIGQVRVTAIDPVTLAQISGTGTVSLGSIHSDGLQDVWYTAPCTANAATDTVSYAVTDKLHHLSTTTAAAVIMLDPGPTDTAASSAVLESGQSAAVATLTPGLPGDTLTLLEADAGLSLGPVLPNGTEQVIYTAPAGVSVSISETLNYAVVDENGVGSFYTASVQLDGGPVIAAVASGDVENGQTVVIGTVAPGVPGDTLTLTQGGGKGVITLGAIMNGLQQILYTAPAHVFASVVDSVSYSVTDQHGDAVAVGTANVQLDRGVVVTQLGTVTLAKGQSAVVDTVTAGMPGDTVTLQQTVAGLGHFTLVETVNGGATQPNQYNVVYTETGAITTSQRETATYQVLDGVGGKPAGDTPYIRLDAGPTVISIAPAVVVEGQSTIIGSVTPGFAGDTDTVRQTGSGAGTVTLCGNKIVYTAAANVTVTASETVKYIVTNQLGTSVSATSTVKVLGAAAINSSAPIAPKAGSFIDLAGGSPTMTFIGTSDVMYLEGSANPTITDKATGLKIDIASANVSAVLKNFSTDSTGVVDLLYGTGGFTTAAAAQAKLVSDGNGGSLLSLVGGTGSIDFVGMAPASVSASHFKIG